MYYESEQVGNNNTLKRIAECESMPFNKYSNSANILLQTALRHCDSHIVYIEYHKWHFDAACDILDHPEKYEDMSCTRILDEFRTKFRKYKIHTYRENGYDDNGDYLK